MKCDTHVYLGPTLNLQEAKKHLHQAYYHPPVKCGDLIRVFRLKPKRIVIIDGIYERTPAVWHKEIMLGLDNGIEIYGAASMGALRAAELSPFGMIGVGQVFQDFLNKTLNDDDEVAVLHQNQERDYAPLNDAMVNIRATLELAYQQGVISIATKLYLIAECKRQFYPHRSLEKSILQFEKQNPNEGNALSGWLSSTGLVDIKKQDAQLVLAHVQVKLGAVDGVYSKDKHALNSVMPVTKFIASLVDDAEIELFDFQAAWLPEQEKKLQALSQENNAGFQLVKILAALIKILFSMAGSATPPLDQAMLLEYISAHKLYSPESDFSGILKDSKFSGLYALICQLICQGSMNPTMVSAYVPVAAFYFQLDFKQMSSHQHRLLRIIVVFISAAHTQLEDKRLKIKSKVLADHLRDLRLWPRLKQYNAANPTCMIDPYTLMQFIALYMQVSYVYQGTRDIINGAPQTPTYFNWLYDAFDFYQLILNSSVNSSVSSSVMTEMDL
ncbi:MAG: TfuA-like protein [Gammaproteobacteria bacterium]|nr:TfuA-like protein [Gammaproteobacteria bacterium]